MLFWLTLTGCVSSKNFTSIKFYGAVGNGVVDDTDAIQAAIDASTGTLVFEKGIYLITKKLVLKSNLTIEGKGAIIRIPNNTNFHVFYASGQENLTINNLNFVGNRRSMTKDALKKGLPYYTISLSNCQTVQLSNLSFKEQFTTCVKLHDVKNVTIKKCKFENIGASTKEYDGTGLVYSYDAIFIGGYKASSNITINNCFFNKIGLEEESNLHYKYGGKINDADGIHLLMAKNGMLSNVNIINSIFNNCSARGIKVQSGTNLIINNNQFNNCRVAIGMPAIHVLDDITITKNNINSCMNAIAPNGGGSATSIINHLNIKKNKASNIKDFIRTHGKSSVVNSIISNNEVRNVGLYFASGLFKNVVFENNQIIDYAIQENKSFYMAFLIWDHSENVEIINNTISTTAITHCAIYNQRGVKDCIIKGNIINIPNNKSSKAYIIHFSDEREGRKLNKVTDNQINGIPLEEN